MNPAIRRGGRDTAAEHTDALVELYADVFAEPPYREGPDQVARFRKMLTEEMDRPGFALTRAVDGGTLVGMAYGCTIPAGEWWHDAATPPLPEAIDVPKFAVMELAVRHDYRGRRLGHDLLGELLRDRAERVAILSVNPTAPAHAIYLSWGWREVGHTPGDEHAYAILLTDLPARIE